VSALPGVGEGGRNGVLLEGQPAPKKISEADSAVYRVITPRYFEVLRIPLKTGRLFDDHDDKTHPRVAIVDEAFVKKHFPHVDPIGKRFCPLAKTPEPRNWIEIVGVVGNARRAYDREETEGTCYIPHAQSTENFMSVVLRVSGDPGSNLAAARAEVLAVNKDMPIYYEMSLQQAIERSGSVWVHAFFGRLFTAFAGVAVLLASIGIYGVMAYTVVQRTQEIGVRMALGAQPREVIAMIVRHGVRLICAGLALGFIAAYGTVGVLAGSLYGVSPHDPPTFALVPLFLAAVALFACYLPSRRATLIDPMIALRSE
jgi:putative ABC transport system permease protein